MRHLRGIVLWCLLLLCCVSAFGCNTVRGAGQDLEKAGEAKQTETYRIFTDLVDQYCQTNGIKERITVLPATIAIWEKYTGLSMVKTTLLAAAEDAASARTEPAAAKQLTPLLFPASARSRAPSSTTTSWRACP